MDQTADFPKGPTVLYPDSGSSIAAAVCLPFSLVPGMDTSSLSYQRALVTLSKQQTAPVSNKLSPLRSLLDRGPEFPLFVFSLAEIFYFPSRLLCSEF
jgi:hypothetical protein